MSSLRNNKNIQSAIASAVFVGLRAEHCTVSELFATKFCNDDGLDVFTAIKELQEQVAQLTTKLDSLKLSDLQDVNISNVSNGDTLVSQDGVWQPAELNQDEA